MKTLSVTHKNIIKVRGDKASETEDVLAIEEPLEISLSMLSAESPVFNKNISITMRTPGHDTDLALGFLFTEGILVSPDQVDNVFQDENKINVFLNNSQPIDLSKIERHFYTSSSCGVCVEVCPYSAPQFIENTGKAEVQATLCKGCGLCAAVCPVDAPQLQMDGSTDVVEILMDRIRSRTEIGI